MVPSLLADVSLDGLQLNNYLFRSPVTPADYAAVLGPPTRVVEPATPAPFGHRNNQIHLFDHHGLYLNEHHATRLVRAVVFVLWLEEATFAPVAEFSGILRVGRVTVVPGMALRDFAGCNIPFIGPTLGMWSAERDGVSIILSTRRVRGPNGRRGKRLRFVDVSVGFS